LEIISCFGVKKPCFGVKKPVFEGFGVKVKKTGSKRGVFEHSKFTENLEFVLFQKGLNATVCFIVVKNF